jgi:maltose-binding protein MalE
MVPPHNFRIYYDSLAAAQSVPAPPQFNEVETALNAVYSKMIANEITPAEMMKTLDRQITSILAKQV